MTMKKSDASINRFNADIHTGLSDAQVEQRKKEGFVNESKKAFGKSYTEIIVTNVFSFFNVLLYIIAGVMFYFRLYKGMFFVVVLLCNTIIGLYEDIMARKLLSKLRLITQATASVIRNGKEEKIETEKVVLDDIVHIEKDSQICVDGVVLEGEVGVNESLLTGEPINVYKTKGDIVYSGTFVTSGNAYIKADKVGPNCVANTLQAKANKFKRSPSEILRSLNSLFLVIGITVITMAIFVFLVFLLQGKFNNPETVVDAVSSITGSLVAMIPSGLYLLTSTALAVGVIGLAKKKAQIQDFYSVEMLARVDTICVDKTGTITDGKLVLTNTVILSNLVDDTTVSQIISNILRATNDRNQTAEALKKVYDLELTTGIKQVLPFSSDNKYSGASFTNGKTYIIGAPEFMPIKNRDGVIKRCTEYTKNGYRVVILGGGTGSIENNKYNGELDALAMLVIKDHIRDTAPETFKWFADNGVEIKVISGDAAQTVSAVAAEAGIPNADKFISLENMSIGEVKEIATKYTVFGRVTPEQKEALVIALKAAKKTVAMTGDGVNDILALKRSDCSIAMASGADAARNVSHILLLDSDFSRLPAVVNEGRRVVNNLQRTASLFVTKTIFAFVLTLVFTLASIIFNAPTIQYPFETRHLYLWEIVTSGMAAFFLALEKNNEKIEGSFLSNVFKKAIPAAVLLISCVLIMFLFRFLQYKNVLSLGIYSNDSAKAMSIIAFSLLGTVFLYKVCSPLTKYRKIVLICSASINVTMLVLTGILSFALTLDTDPILGIPYLEMGGPAFAVTAIVVLILGSLYLLISYLVSLKKGVNEDED